jgi:hypothetical protein
LNLIKWINYKKSLKASTKRRYFRNRCVKCSTTSFSCFMISCKMGLSTLPWSSTKIHLDLMFKKLRRVRREKKLRTILKYRLKIIMRMKAYLRGIKVLLQCVSLYQTKNSMQELKNHSKIMKQIKVST